MLPLPPPPPPYKLRQRLQWYDVYTIFRKPGNTFWKYEWGNRTHTEIEGWFYKIVFLLLKKKNPFKGTERKLKNVTRMEAVRGCFVSGSMSCIKRHSESHKANSSVWTHCFDLFHRLRPNTVLTMASSVNNRDPGVAAGHPTDNISNHSVLNYSSISFHSLGPSTDRVTSLALHTLQHPSQHTVN